MMQRLYLNSRTVEIDLDHHFDSPYRAPLPRAVFHSKYCSRCKPQSARAFVYYHWESVKFSRVPVPMSARNVANVLWNQGRWRPQDSLGVPLGQPQVRGRRNFSPFETVTSQLNVCHTLCVLNKRQRWQQSWKRRQQDSRLKETPSVRWLLTTNNFNLSG